MYRNNSVDSVIDSLQNELGKYYDYEIDKIKIILFIVIIIFSFFNYFHFQKCNKNSKRQ